MTSRTCPARNRNGVILWEGPSALDGRPIVVIATGLRRASSNDKTGPMVQTFILRADVDPMTALQGADASVCGDCPHRPAVDGACYVSVEKSVAAVWRCYARGGYARGTVADGLRRRGDKVPRAYRLRLGSYGDPAAAPVAMWEREIAGATHWAGYTHQWRLPLADGLRPYLMASVDHVAELAAAHARGWRTFRVKREGEPLLRGLELTCPATRRADVTCHTCTGCNGAGPRRSFAIDVHGATAGRFLGNARLPALRAA